MWWRGSRRDVREKPQDNRHQRQTLPPPRNLHLQTSDDPKRI
jgi:hypothetical protein